MAQKTTRYRKEVGARLFKNIRAELKRRKRSPTTEWQLVHLVYEINPRLSAKSTIAEWFTGDEPKPYRVPAIALTAIALALGTTVDQLMDGV